MDREAWWVTVRGGHRVRPNWNDLAHTHSGFEICEFTIPWSFPRSCWDLRGRDYPGKAVLEYTHFGITDALVHEATVRDVSKHQPAELIPAQVAGSTFRCLCCRNQTGVGGSAWVCGGQNSRQNLHRLHAFRIQWPWVTHSADRFSRAPSGTPGPPSAPQGSGWPPFEPGLTHSSPPVPVRLAPLHNCPSWDTLQRFATYLLNRTFINERPIRARQCGVYTMPCAVCAWVPSCFSRVRLCATRLPGSSVRGILSARVLQWVAVLSSRRSSWLRDQTCISHI